MTATYTITTATGRELMTFRADFAQAASPLRIVGEDGETSTPYQVADARHDVARAAKLLNRWCHSEGGAAWEPGRTAGLKIKTSRE